MIAPAVLIMARAPRRGEVHRALEEEIGLDRCVALQVTLLLQAVKWARGIAGRGIYMAYDPGDAAPELRRLVGDDVSLIPQNGDGIVGRMTDAVIRVAAHGPGPILIVWPDLPELKQSHADAAIHDLESGADIVFGPVFDGGFYMIGLARQLPQLFGVPESAMRSPDGFTTLLAAAADAKLEVGLLPAERALRRPADARAVLADPTFTGPVAQALGRDS